MSNGTVAAVDKVAAPPPLLSIPTEVHDIICGALVSTRDLKALRETCSTLRDKTYEPFVKRAFESLEISLDEASLRYACDVADHSPFSSRVLALNIGLRYRCQSLQIKKLDMSAHNLPAGQNFTAESGLRDQTQDFEMLAVLIARFPNLHQIDVGTKTEASSSVYRDSSGQEYATTTVSYAFRVVLDSFALQDPKIRILRAGGVPKGFQRQSVDHDAVNVYEKSRVHNALAHLEEVHLVLGIRSSTPGNGCEMYLADFLGLTVNVKVLHLSFWHFYTNFLSQVLWRGDMLPRLETLHLEAVKKVDAYHLKDFIQRHAETLRTIHLSNLVFDTDDLPANLPGMFEGLQLHTIKLQQLCSARMGMVLFGTDLDLICDVCDQDIKAAFQNKTGPGCKHATLQASDEIGVLTALALLKDTCMLPWALRAACVEEEEKKEKGTEEHAVPDTVPTPGTQEDTSGSTESTGHSSPVEHVRSVPARRARALKIAEEFPAFRCL